VAERGDGRKRQDVQRRRGRQGVQGSRWMMPSRDHLGYHSGGKPCPLLPACATQLLLRVKHTFVRDEMHMLLEQRK
jgi:hypothetical protein